MHGLQVITGSHDKTIRMWDIRAVRPKTMATLTYHKKSVCDLSAVHHHPCSLLTDACLLTCLRASRTGACVPLLRRFAPDSSAPAHCPLEDIAEQRCIAVQVRGLAMHPTEYAFASAGADNVKKFRLPTGEFLHNMLQNQRAIINCAACNEDGVLATGADNGSLW